MTFGQGMPEQGLSSQAAQGVELEAEPTGPAPAVMTGGGIKEGNPWSWVGGQVQSKDGHLLVHNPVQAWVEWHSRLPMPGRCQTRQGLDVEICGYRMPGIAFHGRWPRRPWLEFPSSCDPNVHLMASMSGPVKPVRTSSSKTIIWS